MLKESIDEKSLNFFELCEEVVKLLIIVFLNSMNFLTHGCELGYLVFDLVLKLTHFASKVIHAQLF